MSPLKIRILMDGNNQVLRIPAEMQINAECVHVSRNEQGDLVLDPLPADRGAALLAAIQGFDDDFIAAVEDDRSTAM